MSNNLRVVIASRIWAPEPAAAVFRLSALRSALLEAGAKVRVLTAARPAKLAEAKCDERGISRAPVLRDKSGYIQGFLPYASFDLPLFWRLLFVRRPDVVVSELPPTTGFVVRAVCKLRRIPYVYYAADLWEEAAIAGGYPKLAQRLIARVERKVFQGAAVVMAVTHQFAQRAQQRGGNAVVVLNGVDTTQFSPHGPVERFNAPTFLYAGTASGLQKSVIFAHAFVQVHRTHPHARLVFHAKGDELPEIARVLSVLPAESWEINPLVAPEVIAAKIRAATACLASIAPGEYDFAVPSKAYVGPACGTRCIKVGPNEPGRWVPLLGPAVGHDVGQVAAAMREILDSPDTLQMERAQWVVDNASLVATSKRATELVLGVASGSESVINTGEAVA
ncbi:MAG: glycosyltransferase [Buchananella hordeovulneris]|nr:glycosyltransferase [Buchananella hordeovulneris]